MNSLCIWVFPLPNIRSYFAVQLEVEVSRIYYYYFSEKATFCAALIFYSSVDLSYH